MSSSKNTKPLLLLVTGAWHPPQCYDYLKKDLKAIEYGCLIPKMPSMGHECNGITWEADKATILETSQPYFEQGREIVLVAHSYGGIPGSAATEGQGVIERSKEGKKGGFHSIIFLAGFALPARGMDLLSMVGGVWPDWHNTGEPYIKNKVSIANEKAIPLLYNDVSEEEGRRVFSMLLPQSQDSFETPCKFCPSDITIAKSYVICENDMVIPPPFQEAMANAAPGMSVVRMESGHSPYLSKSKETAELIADIIGKSV